MTSSPSRARRSSNRSFLYLVRRRRHTLRCGVGVTADLALPDPDDDPPRSLYGLGVPQVPRGVRRDLLRPQTSVRALEPAGSVFRAPVPEATVDEDRHPVLRQYEVRRAPGHDLPVQAEPQPEPVHGAPQGSFRSRVSGPAPAKVLALVGTHPFVSRVRHLLSGGSSSYAATVADWGP